MRHITIVSHWLPIITFCPVNRLPDVVYVKIEFHDFAELYAVRKQLRRLVSWRCMFMEDIAKMLLNEFPSAMRVTVTLLTGRHVAISER